MPGTVECLAKQKADIEAIQRACPCGGRLQCECERAEDFDMVGEILPVQEREQREKRERELKEIEELNNLNVVVEISFT